jgi:hypothetical protein
MQTPFLGCAEAGQGEWAQSSEGEIKFMKGVNRS